MAYDAGDVVGHLKLESSEFDTGLSSATGKFGIFSTGTIAAAAGVVAAIAGIGAAAFEIGKSFDAASDRIRIGTGATGKDLDALNASFKAVFTSVPVDATAASTAIADLSTRLGLTGDDLTKMSTQMAQLSKITGEDMPSLIQNTTRVFGDWGIATKDQSSSLDYLFKVSQSTGISFGELSQKIVYFGAPLRAMGFDFQETAAMMGLWEKAGVNTETAMSGMRQAISNFAKAGTDAKTGLLQTIDAIKNAGSQAEATGIAFKVFGARGAADMADAIKGGKFDIDALITSLNNSTETINQAEQDTRSFGEEWTLAKNKLEAFLEPLGSAVFDTVGEIFAKLVSTVEDIATAFAAGGEALGPFSGLIEGLSSFASDLTDTFTNMLGPLSTTAYSSDALSAAMSQLEPVFEAIGGYAAAFGSALKDVGGPVGDLIVNIWNLIEPLVKFIGMIAGAELVANLKLMAVLIKALGVVLGTLVDWISKAVGWLAKFTAPLDKATSSLGSFLSKFGDQKKTVDDTTDAWNNYGPAQDKATKAAETNTKQVKDQTTAVGGSGGLTEKVKEATEKFEKFGTTIANQNNIDLLTNLQRVSDMATKNKELKQAIIDLNIQMDENKGKYDASIAAVGDFRDKVDASNTVLSDLSKIELPDAIGQLDLLSGKTDSAATNTGDLSTALNQLGIDAQTDYATVAEKAGDAYQVVMNSDIATNWEKDMAMLKMLEAWVKAANQAGQDIPTSVSTMLDELHAKFNTGGEADTKMVKPFQNAVQQVSTAFSDAAGSIVGILTGTEEGSIGDALGKMGKSILQAFVTDGISYINQFINEGLKGIINWITGKGGLNELFDGLVSKIKNITGGISSIFSSTSSGGGAVTPSAPAGGGTGGVGGTLGGIGGLINIGTGVFSAVLGAFSYSTLGNILDAINAQGNNLAAWFKQLRDDLWTALTSQTLLLGGKLGIFVDASDGFQGFVIGWLNQFKLDFKPSDTFTNIKAIGDALSATTPGSLSANIGKLDGIATTLTNLYDVGIRHLYNIDAELLDLTTRSTSLTINLNVDGKTLATYVEDNILSSLQTAGIG